MRTIGRTAQQNPFSLLRRVIGAVLFGGAAIVSLHIWAGIGGPGLDTAINGVIYDAVVVCAGLACLTRALRGGPERAAWFAIAAAVLSWAAAEIYWTLYIEGNPEAPYPSPADIGYIAFYPFAALGLYLLVKAHAKQLDPRLWMDGAIAALGTAALGTALIFEFVAERTSGTTVEVATTLAYPLGDVVLLALVVGIIALTRWRPGRTWTLLLAGLTTMAIADVGYTLQTYEATLPDGDWVEPLYVISAVFIGVEAWQPRAATIQPSARFDGWRELVVPGIVAALMISLVSMQYFSDATALTTILWSAAMLAVIGRLALSLRENKRLLEQVQTDRLTGLGSQARLQVDLEAREQSPSEPMTVILLDLNGFKRYNDTFGHPAGDKMLSMLGKRLGAALKPGATGYPAATGYRLGGDEFLVVVEGGLIDLGSEERDAIAVRAAEALTSNGRGFELGAAWGIASIPEEADSPAEAMRLADVRMYAQKESRRVAEPLGALDREALEQSH
ncbi:MAG TPA: GGDEF domain-containing protein [Solirubrobacterales bacterium]|nr:GGDEF domain-containing protein [Solirubrobacterales bacterium]